MRSIDFAGDNSRKPAYTIMQTVIAGRNGPALPEDSERDARHVYETAGKAFHLIEKYQTPPDPGTYSLWYAYAAGTDSHLVAQVEELLVAKGSLSKFEIDMLIQELAPKVDEDAARQSIGQAMQHEIEGVLQIVQAGVKQTDTFNAKLNDAGKLLPKTLTGADVAVLLASLVEENRRMTETTKALNDGLKESQKQIATLNLELEEVQYQSMRDPLTSVSNRRAFDKRLDEEVRKAEATGTKLCLAMADIDHFKRVNDTYGHQTGDAVLQMFSSIIVKNVKGQDMVARIGGEEFAIILPQTDVFAAYNLLIKIKRNFKEAELACGRSGRKIRELTASFGVASCLPGMTPRELIEQADLYLYQAKNEGRDRVKAKGL